MKKLPPFAVDVSPEMQLYKILQRQSYGIDTALAEFVDNSIQSFIDKKDAIKVIEKIDPKLKIKIVVDTSKNQIIIEDNAGGINRKDFQRAIKMGTNSSYTQPNKSLSVYGIGMKSAAIWFTNTWKIETSALNSQEKLIANFDLNILLSKNESKIQVNRETEGNKEHYTRITIKNSLREFDEEFFRDNVLAYLQETFFKFKDSIDIQLEFDNLILQTNESFLKTPEPLKYPPVDKKGNPLKNKRDHTWKKRMKFTYQNKEVRGFILIMSKGMYKNPGIRLLRNRRVIDGTKGGSHQNKPDILVKTSNKFSAQRIYGEIHLDDFSVNFTKTGFDDNLDGLYRLLRTKLTGSPAKPEEQFIHQSEYYRAKKSTAVNKKKKTKTSLSSQKTPDSIEFSQDIYDQLVNLPNKKHARLYKSLCQISLTDHPVLAYVGAWTLLESLATYLGKQSTQAFDGFYSAKINLLTKDNTERNDYKVSIRDIHAKGNINKHSGKYETINAKQLVNDFQIITSLLISCLKDNP